MWNEVDSHLVTFVYVYEHYIWAKLVYNMCVLSEAFLKYKHYMPAKSNKVSGILVCNTFVCISST